MKLMAHAAKGDALVSFFSPQDYETRQREQCDMAICLTRKMSTEFASINYLTIAKNKPGVFDLRGKKCAGGSWEKNSSVILAFPHNLLNLKNHWKSWVRKAKAFLKQFLYRSLTL